MSTVNSVESLKKFQEEQFPSGFSLTSFEDKDMTADGSIFNKSKKPEVQTEMPKSKDSSNNEGLISKAKALIKSISKGKSEGSGAQGAVNSAVSVLKNSVEDANSTSVEFNQFSDAAFKRIQSNDALVVSLTAENDVITSEIDSLNAEIEAITASEGGNSLKTPASPDEVTLLTALPAGGFEYTGAPEANPKVAEMQSRVDSLNLKFNSNSSKINSYSKSNASTLHSLKSKTASLIAKAKEASGKAQVAAQQSQVAQEVGGYVTMTGGVCSSVGGLVLSLPDPTFISKPLATGLLIGGTALSAVGTTTSTLADNSMTDAGKAQSIATNITASTMQTATLMKGLKTPTGK